MSCGDDCYSGAAEGDLHVVEAEVGLATVPGAQGGGGGQADCGSAGVVVPQDDDGLAEQHGRYGAGHGGRQPVLGVTCTGQVLPSLMDCSAGQRAA
jgi:hypothetical protein